MKSNFKRSGKFFVYILECRDGTLYTGYTNDLGKRIKRHNDGFASKYTQARVPVKLAWRKACKNQKFAMRIEKVIKGLKREDKKRIVQGARLDNILRKYI